MNPTENQESLCLTAYSDKRERHGMSQNIHYEVQLAISSVGTGIWLMILYDFFSCGSNSDTPQHILDRNRRFWILDFQRIYDV